MLMELMQKDIADAILNVSRRSAWRIDGTLREFPKFSPVNVWFDYPQHIIDRAGVLKDIDPEETWQKNFSKKRSNTDRKEERKESILTAFSAEATNGEANIKDLAEYLGITEQTVRNRIKEHGGFWIDDGKCGLKASHDDQ